jgi:hypothetical protein
VAVSQLPLTSAIEGTLTHLAGYTTVEVDIILKGVYAKRILFFNAIKADLCSNDWCCFFQLHNHQPFDNALFKIVAYITKLEEVIRLDKAKKRVPLVWDPTHYVCDQEVVAAWKLLTKREMFYKVIRKGSELVVQADPVDPSSIHYDSEEGAAVGYAVWKGEDAQHFPYPRE